MTGEEGGEGEGGEGEGGEGEGGEGGEIEEDKLPSVDRTEGAVIKMAMFSFFKLFLRLIFLFLYFSLIGIVPPLHCVYLSHSPLDYNWRSLHLPHLTLSMQYFLSPQIYTCITRKGNSLPPNPVLPLPSPCDFVLSLSPLDKWHIIHMPHLTPLLPSQWDYLLSC